MSGDVVYVFCCVWNMGYGSLSFIDNSVTVIC